MKTKVFFLLFSIVLSVEPNVVVSTLNSLYSEVTGSETSLYGLVLPILPLNSSSPYDPEMILLLNNTYTGLSLHLLEVKSSENYAKILQHHRPEPNPTLLGSNYISEALMQHLNLSEISIKTPEVYKQNITDISLYSSNVVINQTQYNVYALIRTNYTVYYVDTHTTFPVPLFILPYVSRVRSIIVAMVLGIVLTFTVLYAFFKNYQRLPFIVKEEARTGFNMENIKSSL
jgi:hypothetical protein